MKPKTIETARWGLHPVQVLENSLLSERSGRVFWEARAGASLSFIFYFKNRDSGGCAGGRQSRCGFFF